MKIALNCSYYLPKGGGIKEYIYNLLTNLSLVDPHNDYIIYVAKDFYDYGRETLPSNFKIKPTPFFSHQSIKRSLFEGRFYRQEEKKEQFDVFHSPFFHSPKLEKAKLVITVHDLRFYRFPRTYTYFRYVFLKYAVKSSIKRADKIIAISEFTKNEIVSAYNLDPSKIRVIHEAINPLLFSDQCLVDVKSDLTEKYENTKIILSVGHLEPRKNYERLIHSFVAIKEELKDDTIKLVIIGKKGHQYGKLMKLIENTPGVLYLNFVEHSTLIWFYKNAKLFVFPSFYEGFGFPPLEAAALDTISVVSNVSSLPEVCSDSVLYFDPYNIEDIKKKITIALEDKMLVDKLKILMKKNLLRFSWRKNALDTLSLYLELK